VLPCRDHDPLVDEHAAARRLGLKVKTLRRWRWAGRGPVYHKLGSAVRCSLQDLDDYVLAARRASTSDPGGQR
jgi:Helix-turn-helix domain